MEGVNIEVREQTCRYIPSVSVEFVCMAERGVNYWHRGG
jgi:hypothetical protein